MAALPRDLILPPQKSTALGVSAKLSMRKSCLAPASRYGDLIVGYFSLAWFRMELLGRNPEDGAAPLSVAVWDTPGKNLSNVEIPTSIGQAV
jgi:hypothetical protein